MEGGKEGAGVMKKTDIIPTRPTRASIQSGRKKRKETGEKSAFFSSVLKRRITKHQRFKCRCTDLLLHTFRFFPLRKHVFVQNPNNNNKKIMNIINRKDLQIQISWVKSSKPTSQVSQLIPNRSPVRVN